MEIFNQYLNGLITRDELLTGLAEMRPLKNEYDYTNQAWLVNGFYIPCNHPGSMNCKCFGRMNAGQPAKQNAEIH